MQNPSDVYDFEVFKISIRKRFVELKEDKNKRQSQCGGKTRRRRWENTLKKLQSNAI